MTEQKQETSPIVCGECGADADESANFCVKCGARIEKKAETAVAADDNNDATKDVQAELAALDKFVAYTVLAVLGIPLALWLSAHFTERQQVEKAVAKAPVVAKAPMSFQECVAQATKSLGDDAITAGRLKLADSCWQMRGELELPVNKSREARAKKETIRERHRTIERRRFRREREVGGQERQEGVEELAENPAIKELVAQTHQNAREITAMLRAGIREREYCEVLPIARDALRNVQSFNQKVRDLGLEDARIPDYELRAIVGVAQERC